MQEITIEPTTNYIHLLSGGLDSSYALLQLANDICEGEKDKYKISPIFFNYGQYAADTELNCSRKVVEKVKSLYTDLNIDELIVISLKSDLFSWCTSVVMTGKTWLENDCEIYNRNMVLFSVLGSYLIGCAKKQKVENAEFEISSGFLNYEMDDSNDEFFGKISKLLNNYKEEFEFKIEFLSTMDRQTTRETIKEILKNDEKKQQEFIKLTNSCYCPIKGQPCNECSKCISILAQ